MVVALLLSVVAVYPLVNDLRTDRWEGSYRLLLDKVGPGLTGGTEK